MTVLAPERGPASATGLAVAALAAAPGGGLNTWGLAAVFSPVPVPGTPPGTFTPGVAAAGAERDGGRITRISRLAHAVPGKPDGEAGTRPLRPAWQHPHTA